MIPSSLKFIKSPISSFRFHFSIFVFRKPSSGTISIQIRVSSEILNFKQKLKVNRDMLETPSYGQILMILNLVMISGNFSSVVLVSLANQF